MAATGDTIDRIAISISADADSATKSINKLTGSLKSLQSATSSIKSLQSISSSLKGFANATKGIDLSAFSKLKISSTNVKNLTSLATSLKAIPTDASMRLTQVANAMNTLGNAKTITAAKINSLTKLSTALQQMQTANMGSLVSQFNQLATALTKLTPQLQQLGTSSSQFASSMRSVSSSAKTMKTAVESNTTQMTKWQKVMTTTRTAISQLSPMRLISQLTMFKVAIAGAVSVLGQFINKSNSYIENQNLFQAAMGESTEAASEFGLTCQNLLGIDFNDWMRNQGVFQTLATGMGVASEKADVMSQQLTQLGYDISSFYNISVDEAMLKLQSGLAGELEPLRRIGWDLSVARMNAELAAKGIDANASSMSQAEKVALRYEMIMNQVTITHGDMARTIMAPANSIRVFQAQMQVCARAIGNLFIPILSALVPVAIGVVKAFTWAAQAIAKLFNIDANFEIDYSSLDTSGIASVYDDTADAAESASDAIGDVSDATSKATKKANEYKNTVMGFDELNKLNDVTEDTTDSTSPSSGGGSGGTGGGTGTGYEPNLPTYDFLAGLSQNLGETTDEWARRVSSALKVLIPIVAGIGAAMKAWSMIKALKQAGMLKNLVGKQLAKTVAGIGLAFAGLTAIIINAFDAWTNGLNNSNFLGMLGGIALVIAGLALAFSPLGAAAAAAGAVVGAAIGGIVLVVVGLHDAFVNGVNDMNAYCTVFGSVLAGVATTAGLALLGITGPIGIVIGALVALAGVTLLGVAWGTDECCKSVDALGDVSEETRDRFGSSIDSMEDMQKSLKEDLYNWNSEGDGISRHIISEEDVAWVQEKTQDIHDTIVNNLDSKRNEDLANLDSLAGTLSDERIQELKDKTNQYYDDQVKAEEQGNSEIQQIYTNAANEHRGLKEEEITRLEQLETEQKDRLVNVTAQTQEEINSINQKMAQNNEAEALESAQKVLQNAITDRDNSIQAAQEKYDGIVAEADKLKQAGLISDEEYQGMTQAAESTRDTTIDAANKQWEDIKTSTENGLGEARNKIDTETGEIKSNWDIFCENFQTGWNDTWTKVGNALTDFGTNFGNNVTNFVNDAGKNFEQFGQNTQAVFSLAQAFAQSIWQGVKDWFWQNVIQPLIDKFTNGKEKIGDAFNLAKELAKAAWQTIKDWFWSTVIQPIIDKFNNLKDKIGGVFTGAYNVVTGVWNAIPDFFNGIKDKIIEKFWKIYDKAGEIFKGIGDFIGGIFNGIVNAIKTPINFVIDAINKISFEVPDWVPAIGGQKIGFNIPRLASGGLLNKGQMFIAREAGPELVGSIGSKTAVANNDQIISGIQKGVMQAMLNVSPVFTQSNNSGETTVILKVGNEELARAVAKGNQSLASRGAISFAGGVA